MALGMQLASDEAMSTTTRMWHEPRSAKLPLYIGLTLFCLLGAVCIVLCVRIFIHSREPLPPPVLNNSVHWPTASGGTKLHCDLGGGQQGSSRPGGCRTTGSVPLFPGSSSGIARSRIGTAEVADWRDTICPWLRTSDAADSTSPRSDTVAVLCGQQTVGNRPARISEIGAKKPINSGRRNEAF